MQLALPHMAPLLYDFTWKHRSQFGNVWEHARFNCAVDICVSLLTAKNVWCAEQHSHLLFWNPSFIPLPGKIRMCKVKRKCSPLVVSSKEQIPGYSRGRHVTPVQLLYGCANTFKTDKIDYKKQAASRSPTIPKYDLLQNLLWWSHEYHDRLHGSHDWTKLWFK